MKAPLLPACPYPKLKRSSGHVAGRAFLRGCLSGLSLFKRGQPVKKGLGGNPGKPEKDLGKDKLLPVGLFWLLSLYLVRFKIVYNATIAMVRVFPNKKQKPI